MPWDTIVEEFRLEDANPSPAFFDIKKLRAFNGEYIGALFVDEFVAACQPWPRGESAPWPASACDVAMFAAVAPLAQTRIAVLSEVVPMVDFLVLDEPMSARWASSPDPLWRNASGAAARSPSAAVHHAMPGSAHAFKPPSAG